MRRAAPAVALVLLLAACSGGGEPTAEPSEPATAEESTPDPEPEPEESGEAEPADGDDFCSEIQAAGDDLGVLNDPSAPVLSDDPADAYQRAAAAAEGIEPPSDLADEWQTFREVSADFADRLGAVEPGDATGLGTAMAEAADAHGQEAFDQIAAIGTWVEANCGGGMAESQGGEEVCDLVPMGKLAAVFSFEIPEPESQSYGAGFSECAWVGDDTEVRVSVLPMANLQSDYIDQLQGSQMAGLEDAVGFAGVVGIGHVSTDGWTTAVPWGDQGLMVGIDSNGSTDDDALAREIIEGILAG